MDDATIETLNALNLRFYEDNAASFVAKRQRPWPGWRRLLKDLPPGARVLDVGCGHGRFYEFLEGEAPDPARTYVGLDGCAALLEAARARWPEGPTFGHADVLRPDALRAAAGPHDLVAAFGLLHHMPGHETRAALVRRLAATLAPRGRLALALWRVDPTGTKRQPPPEGLDLEPGDLFLGWGPNPGARRYCHDVDAREAEALVRACRLRLVDDFTDDGGGRDRNRYLVLQADEPTSLGGAR